MEKVNANLQVIGFEKRKNDDRANGWLAVLEPFEDKGLLGVKHRNEVVDEIVLQAEFTYIEALVVYGRICFVVGDGKKCGLLRYRGMNGTYEIIPRIYKKIEQISERSDLFIAYTSDEKNQFDLYHFEKGYMTTNCKEYDASRSFYIKITYIDDQQELFCVAGYAFHICIPRGNYDIQMKDNVIFLVSEQKTEVYNYRGDKLSEDPTGRYVWYNRMLVHIRDDGKKDFYDEEGKKVDLTKYEGIAETDEYVFIKKEGHWQLFWSI